MSSSLAKRLMNYQHEVVCWYQTFVYIRYHSNSHSLRGTIDEFRYLDRTDLEFYETSQP